LEFVVFQVSGVRLCLLTDLTNGPIVHLPDDICVWNHSEIFTEKKRKN